MPRASNLVRCRLCGAMVLDTEIVARYCLVCMGWVRSKPSERARKRQRQRARQRQQQLAQAAAAREGGAAAAEPPAPRGGAPHPPERHR
jgi:hypothetical protein